MRDETFSIIHFAAEEEQINRSYAFDNAKRIGEANVYVVQRTISGAAYFEDSSGRQLVSKDLAMLFSHRESTRYGYSPDATEPYGLQFISFTPSTSVRGLFARLRRDFGSVVHCPENSEPSNLLQEILAGHTKRTVRDRYSETELVFRLLIALYREQVNHTFHSNPVEFGHHYLHDRFRTPIDLKTVATKCGVSREYFAREYTRRFGEPPGFALRRLRLEHANALLHTGLPIEDVAIAAGFVSGDTFYRAFRRAYGVSPGAARSDLAARKAVRAKASLGPRSRST